jgi:hypothetical protein
VTPRGALAAALLLLAGPGCILPALGTRASGRSVSRHDAVTLSAGKTTKAALFDRLGPPMAIAAAGERVQVPAANVHHVDEMRPRTVWFGGGDWTQQGDAWLEPFAARRDLRDTHRVYYWHATEEGGITVFLLVGVAARWTSASELWVLVDEETGLAEDAVFRGR